MKTIYKYQLKITDRQFIEIKGFNGFLKVAEQGGNLCLWCYLNIRDNSIYTSEINIVGTGIAIKENSKLNLRCYFDTVFMKNGLVWHIFII